MPEATAALCDGSIVSMQVRRRRGQRLWYAWNMPTSPTPSGSGLVFLNIALTSGLATEFILAWTVRH